MLARSMTARFAATDNTAMSVRQFTEQVEVLVVDKHRTWPNAIDTNGIFLRYFFSGSCSVWNHRFFWNRVISASLANT